MSQHVNRDLVRRYFNNQCSGTERAAVEEWLTDADRESVVREWMLEQWHALPAGKVSEVGLDHLLEKLHRHIDGVQRAESKVVPLHGKKTFTHAVVRIAAAITILLTVSGLLYWQLRPLPVPATATWHESDYESLKAPDKTASLVLPDGTTVWLNARSKIKYAPGFSADRREVYLEGEAFFDVTEDASRPFIVYTQDIQIRVLGTAFTVKSYLDDRTSEAILVRGKVTVSSKALLTEDRLQMNPNERVVFSRETKDLTLTKVNADDFVLWKSGTLRFENEPIDNVIRSLERWYGVTISVSDNLDSSCRLTARIENETLEEMLELLKSSTGVDYTINGNKVLLKGKLCM